MKKITVLFTALVVFAGNAVAQKEKPMFYNPEAHLVGTIEMRKLNLPDGIHIIAKHKASGVSLWANIKGGRAMCVSPTDRDGRTVQMGIFYKPGPDVPKPQPHIPPSPFCPGGPVGADDGGTPDAGTPEDKLEKVEIPSCGYICTAGGKEDGGSICWKQCN